VSQGCDNCDGEIDRHSHLCQSCFEAKVCRLNCGICGYVSNSIGEYDLHMAMDHDRCIFGCGQPNDPKHIALSHAEEVYKTRLKSWLDQQDNR
jgi:hypothetical protein